MRRDKIYAAIDAERARQDVKFPGQWARFASSGSMTKGATDDDGERVAAFEMLGILVEEVGEVANAIIERDDENLTTELMQVAAVVVAWLETRP